MRRQLEGGWTIYGVVNELMPADNTVQDLLTTVWTLGLVHRNLWRVASSPAFFETWRESVTEILSTHFRFRPYLEEIRISKQEVLRAREQARRHLEAFAAEEEERPLHYDSEGSEWETPPIPLSPARILDDPRNGTPEIVFADEENGDEPAEGAGPATPQAVDALPELDFADIEPLATPDWLKGNLQL